MFKQNFVSIEPYVPASFGDDGDPIIWFPSAIKSVVTQVGAEIASNDRAVDKAGLDNSTVAEWKAFVAEWNNYFNGLGFTSYWSYSTVTTARQYRDRNNDWRDKLESAGTPFLAPKPVVKASFPWLEALVVIAGVGVGAYALSRVVDFGKYLPGVVKKNPRRRRRRR